MTEQQEMQQPPTASRPTWLAWPLGWLVGAAVVAALAAPDMRAVGLHQSGPHAPMGIWVNVWNGLSEPPIERDGTRLRADRILGLSVWDVEVIPEPVGMSRTEARNWALLLVAVLAAAGAFVGGFVAAAGLAVARRVVVSGWLRRPVRWALAGAGAGFIRLGNRMVCAAR